MYITNNNNNNNNINNNNDMNDEFNQNECKLLIPKQKVSICCGCGSHINDQYILRVAPNMEWHGKCLKCYECGLQLDENCTCFVRNEKIYCKGDYIRLFGKKCFKCKENVNMGDYVMRANDQIFHLQCFHCCICNKQLESGEQYAFKETGLMCKYHHEYYDKANSNPSTAQTNQCQNITNLQILNNNTNNNSLNNSNPKNLIKCEDSQNHPDYEDNQNCLISDPMHPSHLGSHLYPSSHLMGPNRMLNTPNLSTSSTNSNSSTSSASSSSNASASGAPNTNSSSVVTGGNTMHSHSHRKDKTTRVRTVLNEKQLHTLRTCYGANPRPDALMKEQLVEMTGLSPRVIRVWFQNKRCKDKKKTILIKQMQEQQKNRQTIGHGIPMVASSPVRNDINNLGPGSQVEIQQSATAYQASAMGWSMGMNGLGDMGGMNDNGRQMHTYDQMMGFGSDEEDCFDQLSDQGGDDSVSSVGGLDDTRIQQL